MEKDTVDKWKVMNEELTRLRAENKQMRNALAKIGEWLLIHDLTIVDKMKQVTAALGAEHEC